MDPKRLSSKFGRLVRTLARSVVSFGFGAGFALVAPSAQEPIELIFAGDLMAHEKNQLMPNYDDIYAAISPRLKDADLAFVNLETPIDETRAMSSYPTFNAKPKYAEAAMKAGFNVFALANNHSNDFGKSSTQGTLRTMEALQKRYPIVYSGLKSQPSDPVEPKIVRSKGWTIGFVSLTNLLNTFEGASYVQAISYWEYWGRGERLEEEQRVLEAIARWKSRVDFLIVGLHDGIEYTWSPHSIQKRFYQRMLRAGVDILWVHHPHVLLPWSFVPSERGNRLILFSMGNLISRQTGDLTPADYDLDRARTGDGALMVVTLDTIGGRPQIRSAHPLLLNNYKDPVKGMVVRYTQDLAESAPGPWKTYFRKRWEFQMKSFRPILLDAP